MRHSGTNIPMLMAVALAAAALVPSTAAADTTTFAGRFVCDPGPPASPDLSVPLAGAHVLLQKRIVSNSGPFLSGDVSWETFREAYLEPDGGFAFYVPLATDESDQSDFRITVLLDDGQGTIVSDYPSTDPAQVSTSGTNQNDVSLQDYGTQALTGEECASWLAFRAAYQSYGQIMGGRPPYGDLHVEYNGPTAGEPWTDGTTVEWPPYYPPGRGAPGTPEGSFAAAHEFAHTIQNYALGGEQAMRDELAGWDFRVRRDRCTTTDAAVAFHEGWAEFWAGDFFPPADCSGVSATDQTVENQVAARLAQLEHGCHTVSPRQMVSTLLSGGRRIHSLVDFVGALKLTPCQEMPFDPRTAPSFRLIPGVSPNVFLSSVRTLARAETQQANRLSSALGAAGRAARTAHCPPLPCTGAIEAKIAPSIVAGELAQARLLAHTLAGEASRPERHSLQGPPSQAFLAAVLSTPAHIERQVGAIGSASISAALHAAAPLIRRDRSAATHALLSGLHAIAGAYSGAARSGHGLPSSLASTSGHDRRTRRVPTRRLVSFAGFPDGTLITDQTADAGATFGAPTALGFTATPPAHLCNNGPTTAGGAAVAPTCQSSISGLEDTGTMAKLSSPAQTLTVQVGTTQAAPGGFAVEVDGFDATGHALVQNAALVGDSYSSQPTGPATQITLHAPGRTSFTYVAVFVNSDIVPGPQLVFNDVSYTGP
jgi:hypothetical protein